VSLRRHLLESCDLHTVLDCPGGTFQGAGVKTVVLFFEKGRPTRKVWYYQLEPGRNLGKTNPLNDADLSDFIDRQKDFAATAKSWSVDVSAIDTATYDLSVKNPHGGETVTHRSPQEIIEEIAALDAECAEVLENIRGLSCDSVFTQRGPGWEEKKLGDVATLQRGFDLLTQDRVSGEYPLVSSSGISDTHHKSAVRGPGVVTGRSGSIGNVFFIEDDFWPLNTVLYVKDFHGYVPRFVFHLLNHFDLKMFATGSGVPTLNRNFVHDELVMVPTSVAKQKRSQTISTPCPPKPNAWRASTSGSGRRWRR